MTKTAFLSLGIGLLICTVSRGPRPALAADHATLRARTDELVRPYLDNHIVVGMTVGILSDGKQEVFGYGRMSGNDRRVPDGDTIYELGSMTKVFTGILLADAVARGQARLDEPAGQLLPAGVKMPAKGNRVITLKDLATHVSGLPRIPDNMKLSDPANPYADYQKEDLYAFLNHHELERTPGEKFEYSNLGQGLLGHLLSLQAKSTYEGLMRKRIAVPLMMSSTTVSIDKKSQSRFAPGHSSDGEPASRWDSGVLTGAGGVCSTVNDLLLFAAANLTPPKGELGEAIEMARTIQQKPVKEGDPPVGLGWHVMRDGTRWHNGETGGHHTMMLVNRKHNSSVILMSNTATSEVDRLAIDIFRMISGAKVVPREFEKADHLLADASQKNDKTIDVPAETLQKYVGRYEFAPGVFMTVTAKDGKLMAGLTGQQSFRIFPRSETVWFFKVVDATVTFHLDKRGKCDSLILFQNDIRQTAKRKTEASEALERYVGTYALAGGAVFTVEAEDGKLMVGLTGQTSFQVFPRSKTVWYYKAVNATITFHMAKNGQYDSLVLFQNGIKQKAKRIKAPADAAKKDEKTVDVPAEALQKLVGKYEVAPGAVFTVEATDGKLMITLTGQPSVRVYARSETVWFPKEFEATITFHLDKNGKCDSLVLLQNGVKQKARRK